MDESLVDHDGQCPRCGSDDIEREVILQTSMRVVAGAVFFCNTCGLTRRALSSDREMWFDHHKAWKSPHVPEDTWEEFAERWPKKIQRASYGRAEPLEAWRPSRTSRARHPRPAPQPSRPGSHPTRTRPSRRAGQHPRRRGLPW